MFQNHFRWLNPADGKSNSEIFHYPDLFREVADALRSHALFDKALEFYEPLQQILDYNDSSYFSDMAFCYRERGLDSKAIDCYRAALVNDSKNLDARRQLALLCQNLCVPNIAPWESVDVVSSRSSVGQQSKKITTIGQLREGSPMKQRSSFTMITPRQPLRSIKHATSEKTLREKAKDKDSYALYLCMHTLVEQVRLGDVDSRSQWMAAAKQLIENFRTQRVFYPCEKYMRFYGYTKEARKLSLNSKLELGSRGDFITPGRQSPFVSE
jgi:general transcription factor 3C polypeptide 3 (transcription factor C subunit 4)